MANSPHVRTRANPGISANELAKYMLSSDYAREGIIRRAKQIATAPVVRYRDLRQGIAGYLSNIMRPASVLSALETRLLQRSADTSLTPFAREDAAASLEALAAFHRVANELSGFQFQLPEGRAAPFMIEGVAVSIQPDVIVTQASRTGDRYGSAIFRMAKGDEAESDTAASRRIDMGRYVATLAYMQATASPVAGHQLHHSLCMAVDIQSELIVTASRNQTQRVNNIRAACRGIAAQWDAV